MTVQCSFAGSHLQRKRSTPVLLVVVVLALVVAACGGDTDETASPGDEGTDSADDQTGSDDPSGTVDAQSEEENAGDEQIPEDIEAAAAEAEELGLQFVTSREELEARAAEETHLEVIWGLSAPEETIDAAIASFTEPWPNLQGNVNVTRVDGVEGRQRLLLEAEAGALADYGVIELGNEVYSATEEYCEWDIYGMAEAGILDIPLGMIDPNNRTVVAAGNSSSAFIYNIDAFESAGVPLPETWDDLLNPDIYGPDGPIQLVGDVRLATFSALVPAWGLERATDWYGTFAEEIQPTWTQRFGPVIQQIQSGEFDAMPFVNTHNSWDLMEGRPEQLEPPHTTGSAMGILFLEPVPVRMTHTHCVLNDDVNPTPYSSLLFLEWLASDDGQLANEDPNGAPYQGSIYTDFEGGLADLLEGMEISVVPWEDIEEQAVWIDTIIEAAGFPQPSD